MQRLLTFIPAYNCEKQITRVLRQFSGELGERVDTLLLIDNRSTDATLSVARQELERTPVRHRFLVRNCENYGLGGSQKVGFNFAVEHGFDQVMILHGDDQGTAADMLPVIRHESAYSDFDAILGARFMSASRLIGYSRFRTVGNQVFNLAFAAILRRWVADLGSGLNLYRSSLFADGFHLGFPDDLTFNYCLLMAHVHFHHRFKFVPISWREADQVSNVKLFSQARRVLGMLGRFAVAPSTFIAEEHRATPRSSYPFETLYESAN